MKKTILSVVIVAVVVGGIGFYSGMKYDQGKTTQRFAQLGANGGFRGNRTGGVTNGGFASGSIIAKDANSITVQLRNIGGGAGASGSNGSTVGSKIVFFGNSTEIGKTVSGTPADLAVGQSITVTGTANSDGSVTAQSIQIRPNMPSPSPTK